jgi:hypothetical protein
MNGTKWVDKCDGRVMTFINSAKYLSVDSVVKGKPAGKYETKDVVVLVDDVTGAAVSMDVALFFLQFMPFVDQNQVCDTEDQTIN